jgi:hypothetical protein
MKPFAPKTLVGPAIAAGLIIVAAGTSAAGCARSITEPPAVENAQAVEPDDPVSLRIRAQYLRGLARQITGEGTPFQHEAPGCQPLLQQTALAAQELRAEADEADRRANAMEASRVIEKQNRTLGR